MHSRHKSYIPTPSSVFGRVFCLTGSHHGFIGESILGGLLDFFEPGLALLLQIYWSANSRPVKLSCKCPIRRSVDVRKLNLRSPLLPFLPEIFNNPHHLLSSFSCIHLLSAQTHADSLIRPDHQQPLHQQMSHIQTYKHTTIGSILLLRAIGQVDEPERLVQKRRELLCTKLPFPHVAGREGIIVEGNAVNDRDQEERPMRATFSSFWFVAVVYREEDVGCFGKVR